MNMVHRRPLPLCLSFSYCHSNVCGVSPPVKLFLCFPPFSVFPLGFHSQILSRLTFVCIQLLDLLSEKPRLKRGRRLSPGMWENISGLAGRRTEFVAVCNKPKRVPQTEQIFTVWKILQTFCEYAFNPWYTALQKYLRQWVVTREVQHSTLRKHKTWESDAATSQLWWFLQTEKGQKGARTHKLTDFGLREDG